MLPASVGKPGLPCAALEGGTTPQACVSHVPSRWVSALLPPLSTRGWGPWLRTPPPGCYGAGGAGGMSWMDAVPANPRGLQGQRGRAEGSEKRMKTHKACAPDLAA